MGDLLGNIWSVLLAFCVISLVVMGALTIFVVRNLRSFWDTSTTDMNAIYARYRRRNPNASEKAALNHLITQQARRCGMIGVLTSLGGFFTMAVALPVDLYLTGRIQSNLARFIAGHYGQKLDPDDPELAEVSDNLSMSLDAQFTRGRRRMKKESMEFITRKLTSKLIPFIGAFLGYRFNYREAKETGTTALNRYSKDTVYLPSQ